MTPPSSSVHAPGPAAFAFAGAGLFLFVVSLGVGAWLFLFRLGDTASAGPRWANVANVALFAVFAGHHSLMARTSAKAWLTSLVPPYLERTCYVWVASLAFIAVCLLWQPVPGVAWQMHGAFAWAGWSLQLVGLGLTLASAMLLDVLDLGGLRQVLRARQGFTADAPERAHFAQLHPARTVAGRWATTAALTQKGPFGWVRHPIYLGWVLMTFPAPAMTVGRLVFSVVSCVYLIVAVPWEERSLERRYGEEYREYKRAVRWRMIPFVY